MSQANTLTNPTTTLRPAALSAFVGQEKLKNVLTVTLAGATARHEAVGHTLFTGPPGLGKTTLANIIANAMGCKLVVAMGPSLTKIPSLATILNQVDERTTVFIDEIHRLPRTVEEALYSVMEDFRLDVTTEKMHLNLRLPRFTLIGATTRFGLITKPLRDRFIHQHQLAPYEPDDIAKIVVGSAAKLGLEVAPQAVTEIARRAKRTPRLANNFLLQSRDFALAHGVHQISWPIVLGMFEQLEVGPSGLTAMDRRILETIAVKFAGGPVGVSLLASVLVEEVDVIEDVYEPFLVQEGLIMRTPQGRRLTKEGWIAAGLVPQNPHAGGDI